jgi:hypothetical protein
MVLMAFNIKISHMPPPFDDYLPRLGGTGDLPIGWAGAESACERIGLPYRPHDSPEWRMDWHVEPWHSIHKEIEKEAQILYSAPTMRVIVWFRAIDQRFWVYQAEPDPTTDRPVEPPKPKPPVDPLLEAVLTGLGLGNKP